VETAIRLIREFSELLKTRFREVVIIAMGFVIYKQAIIIVQLHADYNIMQEKDKQEQIAIFREVMEKQSIVLDKSNQIVQKADTIISNQ